MAKKNNVISLHNHHSDIESGSSFNGEALKENNIIGKKITEARKACKLSQKELSALMQECNMKATSGSISKWEKGDSIPNAYQLLAVCHCLQIEDPFAFFTGLTPESCDFSPELSQQGLNLLQLFKDALISSGQYAPISRKAFQEPEPEMEMPVYDEPAAAGPGTENILGTYQMLSFPTSTIPEDADFGVRVSGSSMYPRYVDQQIVWVKKCEEIYNGQIGVFFYDDKAYIKKYVEEMPNKDEIDDYVDFDGCIHPKVTLYSLNRDCADLDVHVKFNHSFSIVGRVLN